VHRSVGQNFDACLSPTAVAAAVSLKPKRPAAHLADLRHSWSQCAPKMVKALSSASADDAKNSTGVEHNMFDIVTSFSNQRLSFSSAVSFFFLVLLVKVFFIFSCFCVVKLAVIRLVRCPVFPINKLLSFAEECCVIGCRHCINVLCWNLHFSPSQSFFCLQHQLLCFLAGCTMLLGFKN